MSSQPAARQLKDLTVETARARMLAQLASPSLESVTLDQALGRFLAAPILAGRDQPPFDASAMDGWAICGSGDQFHIVGESAAGRGFGGVLAAGQAVRIFTGAPVPIGAERVVIQDLTPREGASVQVRIELDSPRHIRPAGGDFRTGQILLEAGERMDAWRLGLATASGVDRVQVARRPKVVVLSTGDELVQPGQPPAPDQIFDSGGPAIAALVHMWGGAPLRLRSASDDVEAIAAAVAGAGGDLVVTLGGASVGDHDLVKPALGRLGLELSVETVRLRPGKPTWFGRLADGRPVLGLPGNPASGLVCAELFLRPLLRALQGAAPGPILETARLAAPMAANGPREHWARGLLRIVDGVVLAEPLADQDSSLVSVFARAQALIRRPADDPAIEVGATVEILRLERL